MEKHRRKAVNFQWMRLLGKTGLVALACQGGYNPGYTSKENHFQMSELYSMGLGH